MKQLIGIYAAADWAQVEQFADNLRAASDCAVRVRNGALFTPDQREEFDAVYVHGDFPAVQDAYPDAKPIDDQRPSEGLKVADLKAALEAKGIDIPDGAKKADLQALLDAS